MDKIYLEDMVVRFSQEPDCCQENDDMQIIEIHSENNGVGNFFWLKTDRWSFSEPDDLVRLAKRIRAMEETNNKYENGEVIHNSNTDDKPIHNKIKQLEYVDLGLPSGTLWANMNLGATSETDYGDFYMWGSTTPNTAEECNWTNAPFNNGSSYYYKKYFISHKSEWLDDKGNLKPEYDVAYKVTNGMSCMPTSAEFKELYDNTIHEWVEDFNGSGVNGWKFISKTNIRKYIFFPASGFANGTGVYLRGSGGGYWSSSLHPSRSYGGLHLSFGSDSVYPQNDNNRYYGLCVRSVIGRDTTKRKQYEYVDLGLPSGLKWAKCNVGAETETDYGDFYMWGSTKPNTADECTWANAPFNNGSSEYDEEYFNAHKSEWLDDNDNLKPEYDAVTQIMGGEWRMPTKDEIQELLDNTDNAWIKDYNGTGVKGRKFTSKTDTSKYIFIPAAGYCGGGSVNDVGLSGSVWGSSLYALTPSGAWRLGFSSGYCSMYGSSRCYGRSVRGVSK